MAMKTKILSTLFLLLGLAAFGQGVTVVLSNSVMTGITSALATNTPTAGQILQASDTTGVNNAWVTPVSGFHIGFCPMIQGIMTQSGNTANVIPMGTVSGNETGNPFGTANDVFSQCVCPQDSWVSNMWIKITSHATGVAYLGTGTNYCAGIATNGVVVPFSVLSVYFISDGTTTKTNSGTKSVFIKAGTAVTCIVSNANTSSLAPDLGVTVPFYQ